MPIQAERFEVRIPDEKLKELHDAVRVSRLPPAFYEGTKPEYGVTSEWVQKAKERWLDGYDWRAFEKELNKHPQYTAQVPFQGSTFKIHFVHRPSSAPNAIPLLLLHGWPGAYIEFVRAAELLADQGFSVVVPSSPGYAFSQKPPVDKDFGMGEWAQIADALMTGLGYSEYGVQAGDWGAPVSRELVTRFSACKAIHNNYVPRLTDPGAKGQSQTLSSFEQEGLNRREAFMTKGNAYFLEHATRPSTIIHALYASPISLLAWIGEKFIDWTDQTPSLDTILDAVTLWYLTDTFPYSIYMYRELYLGRFGAQEPENYINKPFGVSSFRYELQRFPKSWIATTGKLEWYREHPEGTGHFAAFEAPEVFAKDIKDAFEVLWPKRDKA